MEPLGKIRYLWNCRRYIYQIYRVYFTDEDSVHISCKFCWNNTWFKRDNSL